MNKLAEASRDYRLNRHHSIHPHAALQRDYRASRSVQHQILMDDFQSGKIDEDLFYAQMHDKDLEQQFENIVSAAEEADDEDDDLGKTPTIERPPPDFPAKK